MSNGIIAFMLAAGSSTWVYNKFQRSSGNNTKQSFIASAIVAALVFGVTLTLLSLAT